MGEEQIKQVLKDFGLTETEAEIYLFLSKRGALKGTEIARQLEKDKGQIYHTLKTLQAKGLVESSLEAPVRFMPVPFEVVVESTISAKRAEAERIESTKKELLRYWKSLDRGKSETLPQRFTVIEDRSRVYSKVSQMILNAKSQLSVVSTVSGLMRRDQFGLLDAVFSHTSKNKIKFRLLTEVSEENLHAVKTLFKGMKKESSLEARVPETGLGSITRMLIRDASEVAFFVGKEPERTSRDIDDLCLWTNSKAIVNSFITVFESLWNNSTDVRNKIAEIETGRPLPKTQVFADAEKASKEYGEAIRTASKEVLILTSTQGLKDIAEQEQLLTEWNRNQITVRIMAPITRNNLSAIRRLSRYSQVKHVPVGYLGTTIVDGKYMFQFKKTPSLTGQQNLQSFEKTFYSNDPEYIEKTKKMLEDIWGNAQPPPAAALESPAALHSNDVDILPENYPARKMIGIQIADVKRLTEKQILSKIIHGKKFKVEEFEKDVDRVYSSAGSAIIHPPKAFDLPDLMLEAVHIESPSSHGIGEILTIYQPLSFEGKSGYAPVAVLMTNAEAFSGMKLVHAKDPAAQNVQLVKEDELQIRMHGNTMFIGWTVPIPLFPPKYVLPPACVTIEGYGEVNPVSYALVTPVTRTTIETNYFNAFVTFRHPLSKYSGPGTDGYFCRDTILTLRFLSKIG